MAIPTRFEKARQLANGGFVKVVKTDEHNRITEAFVPGSKSHLYNVIIRRNGQVTVECRLSVGDDNYVPCKANEHGLVCYHALAILILSAKMNKQVVSLSNNREHVDRLLRMGGDVKPIYPHQVAPHAEMWVVHRPAIQKMGSI